MVRQRTYALKVVAPVGSHLPPQRLLTINCNCFKAQRLEKKLPDWNNHCQFIVKMLIIFKHNFVFINLWKAEKMFHCKSLCGGGYHQTTVEPIKKKKEHED